MIIDAHNHLGFRYDLGMDTDDLLRRLDKAKVDKAVCFAQPVVWDNDYVLRAATQHPDRIIPFAGVDPWRKTAVDDVRRCFEHGARGLKLHPVRDSFSLAEPRLVNPLFELCAEWKAPIISHGMNEWSNTPWQFNEMAQRFPQVTLIMAHGGHNWLRDDAIEVVRRHTNLYVETSVMYSDYVRRYVDTVSPERVLMGTDTPTEEHGVEIGKIMAAVPDPAKRALVMGGNIARILDIKG
jgi:predicted TIM-barrel fold metal-dependent hydrolase